MLNVGEISKAMSALLSNGVAKVDKEVLNQLKNKHPARPAVVRLPSQEQIMAERGDNSDHSGYGDVEMKDCKGNVCPTPTIEDNSFEDHRVSPPSLIIKAEHILSAAK